MPRESLRPSSYLSRLPVTYFAALPVSFADSTTTAATRKPRVKATARLPLRTIGNLKALKVLQDLETSGHTPVQAERDTLRLYSGWGGLSLDAVEGQLPAEWLPEKRGLIHEYYTPSNVADAVAAFVRRVRSTLPAHDGVTTALEPSAGIGRLLESFDGEKGLLWTAVEYSHVSATLLKYVYPDIEVVEGPFEAWVKNNLHKRGTFGLCVANPPYGPRGASKVQDPDRSYREARAYAYFIRRCVDFLAADGLGVFLVPAGFLSGTGVSSIELRRKVLLRAHLAGAFRLPSDLFPGALIVIDVVFLRGRGGSLASPADSDADVIAGNYFKAFPSHILGTEVGSPDDTDVEHPKQRRGYQVVGAFTGLPNLTERVVCSDCVMTATERAPAPKPPKRVYDPGAQDAEIDEAAAIGQRLANYLRLVAAQDPTATDLHRELAERCQAWAALHGSPLTHLTLRTAVAKKSSEQGALRTFLSAYEPDGRLSDWLRNAPSIERRYKGSPTDIEAMARWRWGAKRVLRQDDLGEWMRELRSPVTLDAAVKSLLTLGWAQDGDDWQELVPPEVYYTGFLWPRYDRARAHGTQQALEQAANLIRVIRPAVYEEIGVSPRDAWLPLNLVEDWLASKGGPNNAYGKLKLNREHGLLSVAEYDYDRLESWEFKGRCSLNTLLFIGYCNHDRSLFNPSKKMKEDDENIDDVRLRMAAAWTASFTEWLGADPDRRTSVERAYNRRFRGYVTPTYPESGWSIARWSPKLRLHNYQRAGVQRLIANRRGLLAYDVGLGKTYTGLATLALARQEGWVRRPIVLVPNSIVWKWAADVAKVLPDYRFCVIGSRMQMIARGPRKGQATSEVDTPEERAQKWRRFQAGLFDLALVTYTAFPRLQLKPEGVVRAVENVEAIRRQIALAKKAAQAAGKRITERQKAILAEGAAAWVAERLELPESQRPDPDILWEDLGVDAIFVDEAQNFKNLFLPEPREHGVPKYMGNPGDGSDRAWALYFRAHQIRDAQQGGGVFLLSATPAKNSPLEFYSLLSLVDPSLWSSVGVGDPEQFIDRFLDIKVRDALNSKLEMVQVAAVAGFINLHELRDILYRYAEFKTADDVGLKIPAVKQQIVEVDMTPRQEREYVDLVNQIVAAMTAGPNAPKGQILKAMALMALVSIHPDLVGAPAWKNLATAEINPHCPKLDACASRVKALPDCGHIVFVDNVAVHWWMREVLVEAGIPFERIAILNAEAAKSPAERQRIAQDFRGVEGPAKYDVVIANQVAYEGIDLQDRTCRIHHLDLPWEPSTLQQRNGRGVRQGNAANVVEVMYYFSRRSSDGLRFNLIQGKFGWMKALLQSSARETANPGAGQELGPDEILLMISRDPEKTRAALAQVEARRMEESRKKLQAHAAGLVGAANTFYRKAASQRDPTERQRLINEAEDRLSEAGKIDEAAWPWYDLVRAHISQGELVLSQNQRVPFWEGLTVQPSPTSSSWFEVGKVTLDSVGWRRYGTAHWLRRRASELEDLTLEPAHYNRPWPAEADDAAASLAVKAEIDRTVGWNGSWPGLGWLNASDSWLERYWSAHSEAILRAMTRPRSTSAQDLQHVPVEDTETGLAIARGGSDLTQLNVIPPTRSGWARLLYLVARVDPRRLGYTAVDQAAAYWWGVKLPTGLIGRAREGGGE